MAPVDPLLQIGFRALPNSSDAAIGLILNPAGNAKLLCLFPRRRSEKYALHLTCYPEFHLLHSMVVCVHEL